MCDSFINDDVVLSEALLAKIVKETELMTAVNGVKPLTRSLEKPFFSDASYTICLLRYTAHLRHLLESPENPTLMGSDQGITEPHVQHEVIDHYLQVVGELIKGLYDLTDEFKQNKI